eukprot:6988714-Alexandrium_andersonii.AAC.1
MWFLDCESTRRFTARAGLDVDSGLSTDGPFLVSTDYLIDSELRGLGTFRVIPGLAQFLLRDQGMR